jgi:hypothetical protein
VTQTAPAPSQAEEAQDAQPQEVQLQEDERRQLESAKQDLVLEFGDRLPSDQLTARFDAIVAEFEGAPVRTFIPVLARRRVRQELISG